MRFSISEIANSSHAIEFDTSAYPESSALSFGRSSGCVFSLKNVPWVDATVGRTHFSLVKTHAGWAAIASSENHQLLHEGKAIDRIDLSAGSQFQFGNCLFLVYEIGNEPLLQNSNYVLKITENGISREINMPLKGSMSIGREGSGNDIELTTTFCSRKHAIIQINNGNFVLNDVSTNGTLIDNIILKQSTKRINPGQIITIDSSTLVIISNVPQKIDKKTSIFILLSLFVLVLVIVLYCAEQVKSHCAEQDKTLPPQDVTYEEKLLECLGPKINTFLHIHNFTDIADVNQLSSSNFDQLYSDATQWISIINQSVLLVTKVDQFQKIVFQQWPCVQECRLFYQSIFIGFNNFFSSLKSVNSEKQVAYLNDIYQENYSRFEQITECWHDLQKAEDYYRNKQVNEFIDIVVKITPQNGILPLDSLAYADLQEAKIDLQCHFIFLKIEEQFKKIDSSLSLEVIISMVKEIEVLISPLKSTSTIYKAYISQINYIHECCDLYQQLIGCDFTKLTIETVKNVNYLKDKALATDLPYIEKLATAKIYECLDAFGQFIASFSQSSELYRWQTVSTIKEALEALHCLTANVEGTGVRKQQLDTELRSLCANVESELHKQLASLHVQYTKCKSPEQKAAILASMLPYSEPNGRWETWIRKEEQLLRAGK